MAIFLIPPKIQFFNPTTGAFLSGGLLYSYVAGGSLTQVTYPTLLDALNNTNPNKNPLILDSTGSTSIVVTVPTKLVLKDSLGNQIWSIDHLNGAAAATILDTNGNNELSFTTAASASNSVTMQSNIAGLPSGITVSGVSPTIGLNINTKGTGTLAFTAPIVGLSGSIAVSGNTSIGTTMSSGAATFTGTSTVTGAVSLAGDINIIGTCNMLPSGCVCWSAGPSSSPGWLPCDGSAVSRTTYSSLFTAIGTTYGVGNGTTTFNLPTSARNTLVGSGGSGTATLANSVGSTGGEEAHLLSTTELPAHTHSYTKSAYITEVPTGAGFEAKNESTASNPTGSTGGGTTHNNLQPSLVMIMMIRI